MPIRDEPQTMAAALNSQNCLLLSTPASARIQTQTEPWPKAEQLLGAGGGRSEARLFKGTAIFQVVKHQLSLPCHCS